MLTKLSGILSDVVGKLGGSCYARNRYGLYLKNWSIPYNPQTNYQKLTRNNFGYLVGLWPTLTDDQRNGWNSLALTIKLHNKLGEDYVPSGFDTFLSCNQNLFLLSVTAIQDAPVKPTIAQCTWSSFTYDAGTGSISGTLTGESIHSNIYYLVSCSRFFSPGRSYPPVNFGRFQFIDDSALTWSITDLEISNRFAYPFIPGKKYFFRFVPVHAVTGFAAIPFTIGYTVPSGGSSYWHLDVGRLDFTTILQ